MKQSGIDHAEVKSCKKHLPENFWTEHLSFFLKGTGFEHKTTPSCQCDQVRATKMEEDIRGSCQDEKKELTAGRVSKVTVSMSYGEGVITCESYEKTSDAYVSNFIDRNIQYCVSGSRQRK